MPFHSGRVPDIQSRWTVLPREGKIAGSERVVRGIVCNLAVDLPHGKISFSWYYRLHILLTTSNKMIVSWDEILI